jgi:hypothetical protein
MGGLSPKRGPNRVSGQFQGWAERSCRFLKMRERLRTSAAENLMPSPGTLAVGADRSSHPGMREG